MRDNPSKHETWANFDVFLKNVPETPVMRDNEG